jgi:hypothetical protein
MKHIALLKSVGFLSVNVASANNKSTIAIVHYTKKDILRMAVKKNKAVQSCWLNCFYISLLLLSGAPE